MERCGSGGGGGEKSLARISTNAQHSVCFSSRNQKILSPQNSQMKKRNERKIPPQRKTNPSPPNKTEHLSGHENPQLPNDCLY